MNKHPCGGNDPLARYLDYAETVAQAHNSRLTPIRRHVFKCLVEAENPLGAYDILAMMDGVGAPQPPTVYRSLDWLIDIGLVKKIASISKYMVAASPDEADLKALLLCQTCGHAETIDAGLALETLAACAEAKGFQEKQTVIEIIGQCAAHKS